jgi:hypothetical protein
MALSRWLKRLLLSLFALILIFEEWAWDVLTLLGRHLFRLLRLQRFEFWLTQASPPVAVVALLIPLCIVFPLNVLALWMLAKGQIIRGVVMEIVAKLVGTLLLARVFALTRGQLLSYRWFNAVYVTLTRWLRWAHERLAATQVYRFSQSVKARWREAWKKPPL